MTKDNPNLEARRMLDDMVGLAGNRPRHAWNLETIVPADLKPKPVRRPEERKPWE